MKWIRSEWEAEQASSYQPDKFKLETNQNTIGSRKAQQLTNNTFCKSILRTSMSLLSVTSLYIMFRNCTLHSLFRSLCHSPHFLHKNRTLTSNYSLYLFYHTFTDLTNESCSRRGGNDLLLVPRVHCGRWDSWWCTLYKDVARKRHKWPCHSIKWHFCRKQEKGRRRHGEICCRVSSTKQFSFCDARGRLQIQEMLPTVF
jgi:hypothetical protein